ncbi:hypothetical protein NKG05_21055 [Oerskovia sp. M15]
MRVGMVAPGQATGIRSGEGAAPVTSCSARSPSSRVCSCRPWSSTRSGASTSRSSSTGWTASSSCGRALTATSASSPLTCTSITGSVGPPRSRWGLGCSP